MRIAIIHNLAEGGALRRLRELTPHLAGEVQEFTLSGSTVVTPNPTVTRFQEHAPRARRVLRPVLRYSDLLLLMKAWSRVIEQVQRWNPDLVFANPCRFVQAPPSLARLKTPVVYYCDEPRRATYDPEAVATTNSSTNSIYRPLRKKLADLDRRSVLSAQSVLTNSEHTAREILNAYGVRARVLRLGVSSAFVRPAHESSRRHLLSVGTLIPSKGHDLVIAAAAQSGLRLPVVLVAPRPSSTEESRLRRLAHHAGVELHVHVAVSDAELRTAYQEAFATLYLARMEPLGLASLESQACGTPVIVSDEGGLRETVRDGETGFVVPRSADGAARALSLLIRPDVRDRVTAALASQTVLRWEDTARHLNELLNLDLYRRGSEN